MSLVVCFFCIDKVYAADTCTYYNYYFFIDIETENYYSSVYSNVDDEGEYYWYLSNKTFFPTIPVSSSDDVSNAASICLEKYSGDSETDEDSVCYGYNGTVWSLSQFYSAYLNAVNSSESVSYTVYDSTGASSGSSSSNVYTVRNGDVVYQYFTHGDWFVGTLSGDTWTYEESGAGDVYLGDSSVSEMVEASVLPNSTSSILLDTSTAISNGLESFAAYVTRVVYQNKNTSVTPFNVYWSTSSTYYDSILSPALTYVSYTADCPDDYTATIDYFYEGTTDRVEFDNDEDNPWYVSGLDDGYSITVVSPTKENCTADLSQVDVYIDGADFYTAVYYTCSATTAEETTENPKTGGSAVVIACVVIIGIVALCYVFMYSKKKKGGVDKTVKVDNTKEKVEDKKEKE